MSDSQSGWKFCQKCQGMYFAGHQDQGHCPVGGTHDASASGNYLMAFGEGAFDTQPQAGWRFCQKCQGLFFDGPPDPGGACPAGAKHDSGASGHYTMLFGNGTEPNTQGGWRFCRKCQGLFFAGNQDQGHCPVGGAHDAGASGPYQMLRDVPVLAFDAVGPDGSTSLTSNLALGGSAHLVIDDKGNFTFSSHAHDSGFDNIDYTMVAVLMTPSGLAFTFQVQGSVEGTVAGLPFGTPNRDDNRTASGSNPAIRDEFNRTRGAVLAGTLAGTDTLVHGLGGLVGDALKAAAGKFGLEAATAVIALV